MFGRKKLCAKVVSISFQMMNVPYYAGYDNAFSGAQNLPTATNDTRLPPKTPTPPIADNKVKYKAFFLLAIGKYLSN